MEIAEELTRRADERSLPLPSPAAPRALRIAAGLAQSDLGAVIGVTRATITRYELGIREPRGPVRRAYRDALRALELRRHG